MEDFPTPAGATMQVSAVALVDQRGRILLQLRPAGKHHAGLWEYPGGKQEPHETAQNAAVREIAEELGIGIHPADLQFAAQAERASDHQDQAVKSIVISLYVCRLWQGDPAGLDGQQLGWFAPAELASLAMPPLDIALTPALLAELAQQDQK